MHLLVSALLCFCVLVASSSCRSQPVEAHEANSSPSLSSSSSSWLTNLRANNKDGSRSYLVPNSLASFFFYANPRQTGGGELANNRLSLLGSKRSSSALDSLAGVTIGKRSAPTAELINFEPIYGRRFGPPNSMPRVFDMRTAPFESLDTLDYSTE